MAEESAEVPGELTGTGRSRGRGFSASPRVPLAPDPLPSSAAPRAPPRLGAPEVGGVDGGVAGGRREVCSRLTAREAQASWGPGTAPLDRREPGAPAASVLGVLEARRTLPGTGPRR